MNFSRKFTLILSSIFFLFFTGLSYVEAGGKSDSNPELPKQIVMCYLPNEATEEFAEYRGMIQDEMTKAVGIPVKEINVADYNAVVEAMRNKHADIGNFGPVTYVQAAERSGAEALVVLAPFGDKNQTGYTSQFIVKADSSIRTLDDLRGKTFAFVDPSSTSGNYVPTLEMMNKFGLSNEDFHTNGKFFSSVTFSGRHQNGLMAVIMGDIDAAPIASDTLALEILAGRVKESDIRIIHESPRIPSSPIAIRKDIPQDIKAKIIKFYLDYNNPDYFQNMHGMAPEKKARFIVASDSEYDYVRDLMAKVMPR